MLSSIIKTEKISPLSLFHTSLSPQILFVTLLSENKLVRHGDPWEGWPVAWQGE
jgi:hypothetical protein